MSTRWQDIYTFLKNKGIDVYSPGQHQGDCLSPYVVIRELNSVPVSGFSTNTDLYAILCYVPENHYSQLKSFVNNIEELMKELEPMIMPTHQRDSSFYDEDIKAHMISLRYQNRVKQY